MGGSATGESPGGPTPPESVTSLICYASQTSSQKNLNALRREDWRLLIAPAGDWEAHGFKFGIDNGAWRAKQLFDAGKIPENRLDYPLFLKLLRTLGQAADFAVLPDVVMDAQASMELTLRHRAEVCALLGPDTVPLVAVQDGMEDQGIIDGFIRPLLAEGCGLFVGGGDPWKEEKLPIWGDLKREFGCWLHVGRVNTARRMALCAAAEATSVDGTSGTKFSVTVPMLAEAARQPALFPSSGANYVAR